MNTDIATVEPFLPHPPVFTQPPSTIIPLLPTRPSEPNTPYTIAYVNPAAGSTITITSDQVYYGVNLDDPDAGGYGDFYRAGYGSPLVTMFREYDDNSYLINQGLIWNGSTLDYANAVWAEHLTNSGNIIAEVGPYTGLGSYRYLTARAVVVEGGVGGSASNPTLNNSGSIFAVADQGNALAVSFAYGNWIVNSGLIAAQATAGDDASQSGGANGLSSGNGGYVLNEVGGRILVEGDTAAVGVFLGRGSHPAFGGTPNVNNRGLIEVVSHNPNSPSIGIYGATTLTETMLITNSGTIRADIAILTKNTNFDTSSAPSYHRDTVQNLAGGLIEGDIRLDTGNDTLTNAGTIRGTVDMGGHDDLVDNSAGTIEGVVLLGDGTDSFIGGGGFRSRQWRRWK